VATVAGTDRSETYSEPLSAPHSAVGDSNVEPIARELTATITKPFCPPRELRLINRKEMGNMPTGPCTLPVYRRQAVGSVATALMPAGVLCGDMQRRRRSARFCRPKQRVADRYRIRAAGRRGR